MQVPTQPQGRKAAQKLKEHRGQRAEGHLRPAGSPRGACHEDRYLFREWKEDGDRRFGKALSFWQATWLCDDKEKGRTFLIKKGPGIDIFLIFAGEKAQALRARFRQLRCHGLLARTGSLHGSLHLQCKCLHNRRLKKTRQGPKASRDQRQAGTKGKTRTKGKQEAERCWVV